MAEPGEFLESFRNEEKATLAGLEFAVVVGRFYEDLARRLLAGAKEGFGLAGVAADAVSEHSVPGAFELPFAAQSYIEGAQERAQSGGAEPGGVACLGVVIRGETDHYDFVCAEAARGIQEVQLHTGVPCSFGVITCDTMEQAEARAGGGKRDQGRNAALTVARMAVLRRRLI
ncbi:MAG TPA: 6,7-dimethyl-8-ribityllumazine synthase [Solirubrobacterales bacterium]|jgi:6,7-dimethyl-8-ribityllumazine synthase|nr:6,7-dimethyl-8-ribityllumazine synthase [Solirubrobacterales bacterium]